MRLISFLIVLRVLMFLRGLREQSPFVCREPCMWGMGSKTVPPMPRRSYARGRKGEWTGQGEQKGVIHAPPELSEREKRSVSGAREARKVVLCPAGAARARKKESVWGKRSKKGSAMPRRKSCNGKTLRCRASKHFSILLSFPAFLLRQLPLPGS